MIRLTSVFGFASPTPPSIFGILFNFASSFLVNSAGLIPIFCKMLGISPSIWLIKAKSKCSVFISECLYLIAKLWASEIALILFCVKFCSIFITFFSLKFILKLFVSTLCSMLLTNIIYHYLIFLSTIFLKFFSYFLKSVLYNQVQPKNM